MSVKIDGPFIKGFIEKHNISISQTKDKGDREELVLKQCPFNENHIDCSCLVIGKESVSFKCKHDSCKDKKIRAFIQKYEPEFQFTRENIKTGSKDPPKIQCVANVEKRSIQYLIKPFIPKQNVTALVGDGGVGKTFTWIDFASAVTNGTIPAVMGEVPEAFTKDSIRTYDFEDTIEIDTKDANDNANRTVLYFTSEDSTDITLKERFESAGANVDCLFFVDLDDENFKNITLDSKQLEECVANIRPALCVLDPIQSFVTGKMGERNNMRRQMDCLTRLAKAYDTAFLIVVHTNKSTTTDARTKVSDSSDIWDKCRSVLFVGKVNGDKNIRYLSQEKGNYLSDKNDIGTQLFTIRDAKIIHTGSTDKKYFDFATENIFTRDSTVKDTAKEFILTSLQQCEQKEMLVKDLTDSAKAYGISKPTLERAKNDLKKDNKIKYRKESSGKNQGVVWYIGLNTISNE